MLDLDKYINDSLEIKIFGKTITVKEPTSRMYGELNKIESGLNKENMAEKRVKTAVLFLNNNTSDTEFTEEQLACLPFAVVDEVTKAIVSMREKVEQDPNSKSPSRKAK